MALAINIAVSAAAALDISTAFPRPTAAQAISQLATAAELQMDDASVPIDIIDRYGGSEWLASFEAEIAEYLGMDRGQFYPTGVAAQNSALAVHASLPFRNHRSQPPPCFMMHPTSHLHLYEENAYKELLGANALLVGKQDRVLSANDLEIDLKRLIAVGEGPDMILIELPQRELGCVTPSWSELLEMRALATKYDVPLHLDGARLWEIAPHYQAEAGVSLKEVVALFDSAYVSFVSPSASEPAPLAAAC